MYKFVGLYILIIIGIFIEPDFLGSLGNFLFKLLLLGGISFLVYEIHNSRELDTEDSEEDQEDTIKSSVSVPESVFETQAPRFDSLYGTKDSLRRFMENQFSIIINYTLPHNGFLIYANGSGSLRILDQRCSFAIQPDPDFSKLVTLLGENEGILMENDLEEVTALFPFYDATTYIPKSLLAFQTVIDKNQRLYWFMDAGESQYFNIQDKTVLLQINGNTLFALTESLYNQDLLNDKREIKTVSDLSYQMNQAADFDSCIDFFAEFIINEFEAHKLTIAVRDGNSESGIIKKSIGLDDSIKQGDTFPLSEGLHGWVIMKNKPYLIDNIDKGEYFVPRFSRAEKTNYGLRSFLSVPLQFNERAYGMVSLEDKTENKYNENDKNRLISFATILNSAYKRFSNEDQEIGE